MFSDILQPTHLLFVLVIALLVLGPKRLPEVGRALGRTMRDFRHALSTDELHEQMISTTSAQTTPPMSEQPTQVAETPVAETPVPETPATETPATETPATEPPAAATPATEPPVATEAPSALGSSAGQAPNGADQTAAAGEAPTEVVPSQPEPAASYPDFDQT